MLGAELDIEDTKTYGTQLLSTRNSESKRKTGRQTGIMTEWEYLAIETQEKKNISLSLFWF